MSSNPIMQLKCTLLSTSQGHFQVPFIQSFSKFSIYGPWACVNNDKDAPKVIWVLTVWSSLIVCSPGPACPQQLRLSPQPRLSELRWPGHWPLRRPQHLPELQTRVSADMMIVMMVIMMMILGTPRSDRGLGPRCLSPGSRGWWLASRRTCGPPPQQGRSDE